MSSSYLTGGSPGRNGCYGMKSQIEWLAYTSAFNISVDRCKYNVIDLGAAVGCGIVDQQSIKSTGSPT